jgi:hypothetical protein
LATRVIARVWRRGRAGLALAVVAVALAACGAVEDPGRTFPVASVGPAMTVSPTVDETRAELVRVLVAHSLQLIDTQTPVRLAESPLLTVAPRAVYQVVLPKDPLKGFIVVYEFSDPGHAATAAAEEQAYLGSGPGRVQTPQGTVTLIRQVGSTIVLYSWLPAASQDPSAPGIQASLESLGIGFPVPN